MLKRLAPMSNDKVIVFVDSDGSWANIEKLTEKEGQIELTIEHYPIFSET